MPTACRLSQTLGVMSSDQSPSSRVLFRVPEEDGSAQVERLWASHVGDDCYRLDNSPFYAYSVSWEDVVYAPFDNDEGHATFQRVVSKSGNRTIRIFFDLPVEAGNTSDVVLQGLVALGCSYEGANRKYLSINIPPVVELDAVRSYLIEAQATWEQADPTNAELFQNDA